MPDGIPFCHTKMGSHVTVFGGIKAFQKKKPWRKDGWENDDDVDSVDPEVNFVFYFSSNEEPKELLGRVSSEWGKLGGRSCSSAGWQRSALTRRWRFINY